MHELKLSVKNLVLITCGQKLNTRTGFYFLASALFSYCLVRYAISNSTRTRVSHS